MITFNCFSFMLKVKIYRFRFIVFRWICNYSLHRLSFGECHHISLGDGMLLQIRFWMCSCRMERTRFHEHTKSRHYTTASAYELLRHKEVVVNWNNLWLCFRDSLKTKAMLNHRGMDIDDLCVFCNQTIETVQHFIFGCGFCCSICKLGFGEMGIRRKVRHGVQWF